MKSITIHNLDDSLDLLIREKAKKGGMSLNKTIQQLLKRALGLNHGVSDNHKKDFIDLFGVWSREDEEKFIQSIRHFSEIDESDWK